MNTRHKDVFFKLNVKRFWGPRESGIGIFVCFDIMAYSLFKRDG